MSFNFMVFFEVNIYHRVEHVTQIIFFRKLQRVYAIPEKMQAPVKRFFILLTFILKFS